MFCEPYSREPSFSSCMVLLLLRPAQILKLNHLRWQKGYPDCKQIRNDKSHSGNQVVHFHCAINIPIRKCDCEWDPCLQSSSEMEFYLWCLSGLFLSPAIWFRACVFLFLGWQRFSLGDMAAKGFSRSGAIYQNVLWAPLLTNAPKVVLFLLLFRVFVQFPCDSVTGEMSSPTIRMDFEPLMAKNICGRVEFLVSFSKLYWVCEAVNYTSSSSLKPSSIT